ncbi:MAG: chitobiase/beta-hexosaminidase C-terminal domain-containing protein, partial [Spirochaetales bacterium]|nr:chitobiase/beta-hexosaminidase C-terminal domain-containing protein [Spirochaetales bacterium]
DLGEMHPTSGSLSPVSQSTWGSSKYVLGANVSGGNTTFALYSANATKVLLEIYDAAYGEDAKYDYWMTQHSSSKQWQAKLQGDLSGKYYAFRVWGPNWKYDSGWKRGGSSVGMIGTHDCDSNGNRFNPNKVVFDPYAREITHDPSNATALAYSPTAPANPYGALSTGDTYRNYDSGKIAPKGIVVTDNTNYGTKPAIPQKDAIIYEAHVRGITKHSSSANLATLLSKYSQFGDVVNIPTEYQGTYKGAAMLVPYLKALGINTIELLPVHETDNDANPDDGPGGNFWGYMTFNYFAPDRRYSSDKTPGGPTKEFKEMVKAFHDAGMEVYLDVVYNHTGEGGTWHGSSTDPNFDNGKQCTVVSMRGIDNATYYSLVKGSKWAYWETTGCGNNMQCDNAYVRQFILDSLTYWIDTMGVDGFRFDLATTLGREYNSSTGNWNYNASAATLTQIAALGQTKNAEMIAESWDCGDNSYQVGNFPDGWAGWNGYYRDNIRGFVGNGQAEAAISYTTGLYGDLDHFGVNEPSINFIVAHDGFTLADLCSYSGSGNYYNDKLAWPCGPSDGGNGDQNNISTNIYVNGSVDEQASRRQRARNYFAMQMFSAGIPMIVYGDEFGRTQNGNNNPYNIDSVATWNNYNMVNTASPQAASTGGSGTYTNMFGTFGNTAGKNGNFDFARFVMNERLNNNSLRQVSGAAAPMEWYSTAGTKGWADEGNAKAIMINGSKGVDGAKYYMMINMKGDQTTFTVPKSDTGSSWVRIVDTGNWAEADCNYWEITDPTAYSFSAATEYGVGPYTVVIFKQVEDTPTCAAPTISGTTPFDSSTSVTMSCSTSGVTIYYTTDGSVPTASSTRYTSAVTITKTTTFKAIAVKAGYNNSSVTTKKFTKNALT